jgi:hypothetical protein
VAFTGFLERSRPMGITLLYEVDTIIIR